MVIGTDANVRRICPGRFLAEDSIWIAITTTLATLVVSRVRGEDGEEIIPEVVPVSSGVAKSVGSNTHLHVMINLPPFTVTLSLFHAALRLVTL